METLWKQHPLFLSQIMEAMERAVDWQKSTFSTYMRKLCENGYIGYTTISGNRAYTPLADREECIRNESRHVMSKLTDKGAKMLLACMIEETGLNDKDRLELQDLITKLGSEPKREKPEAE